MEHKTVTNRKELMELILGLIKVHGKASEAGNHLVSTTAHLSVLKNISDCFLLFACSFLKAVLVFNGLFFFFYPEGIRGEN